MTKLLASWDVKVQTVMEPHYVSIYVQFPPVHVEFVMWKQWSPARGYYTNMDQNWCMSNNWIAWLDIYLYHIEIVNGNENQTQKWKWLAYDYNQKGCCYQFKATIYCPLVGPTRKCDWNLKALLLTGACMSF